MSDIVTERLLFATIEEDNDKNILCNILTMIWYFLFIYFDNKPKNVTIYLRNF